MAQKTDLNVSPYYDDFAEDKNFHRVLFKPSAAIQARELTQLQSILQNQIERFGSHIFKEGAIILGARTSYDNQYFGVRVEDNSPNASASGNAESFREAAVGKFYQGLTSGVIGKIVNTSQKTTNDNLTLHVKYQRTGNSGSTFFNEFQDGETLNEVTQNTNNDGGYTSASSNNQFKVISISGSTDVGSMVGSAASISEGIIYTRGMFVRVPAQTIILEKYSNTPSYKVGVEIGETLTSSTEDSSLLDNAQGTTNENAPGADRLKVSMTLAKKSLTATDSTDFIELMRLSAGEVVKKQEITEYNRLQETLARRTFDESGDYTLQPFTVGFREHLNTLSNNGVYTSTDSPKGDPNKFITIMSAGKAYVRGFEVDKQTPTFLTFDKARTTKEKTNIQSPFRIGNFLKVKNTFGLPDIGSHDDSLPHNPINLYDKAKGTSANDNGGGQHIGFARARAFEGDSDSTNSELYLFDVQMFTKITVGSAMTLAKGQKVLGATSGATGIVAEAVSSGTTVLLHSVVGTFQANESLRKHNTSTGAQTISTIRTYDSSAIKRVHMSRGSGGSSIFAADTVLDDNFLLSGTGFGGDSNSDGADDEITGVASQFTAELVQGDQILLPDGNTRIVDAVTDNDTIEVDDLNAPFNGQIIRQRAKFYKPDQTVAISGLPNSGIKTITQDSETVQRQFLSTSTGSGLCVITISDGEFLSYNEDRYSAENGNTGALIALKDSGTGTGLVSLSNSNKTLTVNVGVNSTKCKIITTIVKTNPDASAKSLVKGAVATVNTANSTTKYGTSYQHQDITLGVPDVYKIRGIFEGGNALNPSGDGSTFVTTPNPPSFVYTASSPTSDNALTTGGTEIVGSVSNARGVLIENDGGVCYFYYKPNSVKFQSGEEITFTQGTERSGTIASVTLGSKNITSNFVFDDGQRDGYYGVSKITRKKASPAPNNPIMVVYDYFTHGAGNTFTQASYSDLDIDQIPNYVADRFDPQASFDTDGDFPLADCIDYRPVASRLFATNPDNDVSAVSSDHDISGINANPFNYGHTSFEGIGTDTYGGHSTDIAKIGTSIQVDYEHYLSRIDRVFLTSQGEFNVVKGEPSENPKKGAKLDNAIELAEITIPAFTPNVEIIKSKLIQHRRYTMRDIDGIQRRLTQLETAVSLSMLEEKTQTLQVLDDEGFDRFKSGFVVDPFKGHGVGDVFHPDYGIAVDQKQGIARPSHRTNYFDMEFNSGASQLVTKTGDLVTLPFSETDYITSSKASKRVNVNPYDIANFVGRLELSPDKDVWHDLEQLPSVTSSQEGNFDAILAGVEVGTVWNDWQQTWAGTPITTTSSDEFLDAAFQGNELDREDFDLGNFLGQGFRQRRRDEDLQGRRRRGVNTTITRTIPTRETRTGLITNVVEDIATTRNDRVVGISVVNFMRKVDVGLFGELLKPNTALNVYFDNINVNAHITPSFAQYSVQGNTNKGSTLKTDDTGRVRGTFHIPNDDTLRFETGIKTIKISDANSVSAMDRETTSAFANFMANGSLTSQQTEIINTRNGRITTEAINESRAGQLVTTSTTTRWVDPLAQSFLVEQEEGVFVNSIEVYFAQRDGGGLPVTCSIRQMLNGSPTQKVMPFAEKSLYPSEISTSTNASTATKFTFPSPVYLNPNTEYCFVLESNSNKYEAWVGQMGDFDVLTNEPIDKQPYAGVLFKSQNSSTWTPEQMQDLKFKINRAKFSTTGTAVLENKAIPSKKLKINPIEVFSGDRDRVKVHHQSHGMYSDKSNFTISGVEGDKSDSILSVSVAMGGNAAGVVNSGTPYTGKTGSSSGNGAGHTFDITLSAVNAISNITINNPGYNFAVNETITILNNQVGGSNTNTFATLTVTAIDDSLGGIPISKINKTHDVDTNYANGTDPTFTSDMDSYEFNIDLGNSSGSKHGGTTESTRAGGNSVLATENMYFDVIHTLVPNIVYPKTGISANMFKTSTGGVNNTNTPASYSKSNVAETIVLNDNNFVTTSGIVASQVNETGEMGGDKSFKLELAMTSESDFVSPVVDVASVGANTIMNRINSVSTIDDLSSNRSADLIDGTEPEGDNNAAIYCTRLVQLENPASQLKVIFDGYKPSGSASGEIKTYYKLLSADSTLPVEELGWTEFATTNVPDADSSKFRSYEYDATNLDEFVGFAIKVVMKSKDTTMPCAIRAFRSLALA